MLNLVQVMLRPEPLGYRGVIKMAKEKSWGGKRQGAGKKKQLPKDAIPVCIKMTPTEKIKVKAFLADLRKGEVNG